MSKDKLTDYSATNGSNTDVGGINIDEGMLPSAVNNALREILTHLKNFASGTDGIDVLSLADDDASAAMKLQAPASVTSDTTLTLPDGDGADGQALITDGSGTLAWAYPYGNRNLIINGAQLVDQRNGGSSVTINNTNETYVTDRFICRGESSDGVFTAEQDTTTPDDFKNSLKIAVTTADSSIGATQSYLIRHKIEGQNVTHLNWGSSSARKCTLSFSVRSSVTGTFGGSFNNSAFDRSYPFTYTISAADTWERKEITVDGPTDGTWLTTNGAGIIIGWSLGAGSSRIGTADAWASANYQGATGQTNLIATNSSTFYITGIQLEVGSATPFEHRSFGDELARCQRYLYRIEPDTGVGAFVNLTGWDSNNTYGSLKFPVQMRAQPSFSYGAALDDFLLLSNGSSPTPTTIQSNGNNRFGIELNMVSTSNITGGRSYWARITDTSNGFVQFDAEL